MIFTQHYIECLSQASYLIADEASRHAVVVDPRRDVEDYLAEAASAGLTIVGVIDTHFHADFVAGHLELAAATGAWIGFGQEAAPDFAFRALRDGERIDLGDVTLEIMATPGHTPESISVLVYEHAVDEVPWGVLTGDALFIGDVGRPDLLASVGVTADELARRLYQSVQVKLMGLPDSVRVFPAHGAGSACGKNLSTERQSTIGEQRVLNYACRPMAEDQFVAIVTADQPAAPGYFGFNALLNRQDHERLDGARTVPALDLATVEAERVTGAVVLDTREPGEYAAGHLSGSVNVSGEGRLAETVGSVLPPETRVILLSPTGAEQRDAMRLARIGYDNVIGYVADPIGLLGADPAQTARSSRLTVAEALNAIDNVDELQLVDLRNPTERAAGMLSGAVAIPLAELPSRVAELDLDKPILVYCATGWRSIVASSVLARAGARDVSDLLGGYTAWCQLVAT